MTTSNHLLVGTLIALTVKEPILVIPLALLSHFALDMLPHFGNTKTGLTATQIFRRYLSFEIFGIIGLVLLLSTGIYGFNLITLAAVVTVLPDLEWPVRYAFFEARGKIPPATISSKYHKKIQWCEREWAAVVEILFFVGGFWLLHSLL